MNKKRISVVAYPLVPGKIGGVETYFREIVSALLANLPADMDMHLLVGSAAKEYSDFWIKQGGRPENVTVSNVFPRITSNASRAYALGKALCRANALRREVAQTHPDLVFFPLTVCVPLLAKRRSFPVVTTIHDVLQVVKPDLFKSFSEEIYRSITYPLSCSGSDAVIAPSSYTKKTLERHFKVKTDDITVIPYGLNRTLFSTRPSGSEADTVQKHGLADKRFVIYPANTWIHKNHASLIEVWRELLERLPADLWLVLCGQVFEALPNREEMRRYRICHLGHVPQLELADLYRCSHAMVFPSLFEGFGAPPLEAMACGAVTICSNKASLAEVIPENYRLSFNPEDKADMAAAILLGCVDQEVRGDASLQGIKHSSKFSWDSAARAHIKYFRSVLTDKRR